MPGGFGVSITGVAEARHYLDALSDHGDDADGYEVRVGSPLAYAYGIETGRHRNGRLARAAGGLHYLEQALKLESKGIAKTIAKAVKGQDSIKDALVKSGLNVEARAKQLLTPFPYSARTKYHTGTLRRSLQTVYPGRPVMPVVEASGRAGTSRTRRG